MIWHVTGTFLIRIAASMSVFDYCNYPSMTLEPMHLWVRRKYGWPSQRCAGLSVQRPPVGSQSRSPQRLVSVLPKIVWDTDTMSPWRWSANFSTRNGWPDLRRSRRSHQIPQSHDSFIVMWHPLVWMRLSVLVYVETPYVLYCWYLTLILGQGCGVTSLNITIKIKPRWRSARTRVLYAVALPAEV